MPDSTIAITVEMVADYLRQCEDYAHYTPNELAENAFAFAVKLVREHGLNRATVKDYLERT